MLHLIAILNNYFLLLYFTKTAERTVVLQWLFCGGCSGDDVEANEDLEEGELLDDGDVDEKPEESETVEPEPLAPAAIQSLLDMKISPPRNGKTIFANHNTLSTLCS